MWGSLNILMGYLWIYLLIISQEKPASLIIFSLGIFKRLNMQGDLQKINSSSRQILLY